MIRTLTDDILDEFINFTGWHGGTIKEPTAIVEENKLLLSWDLPGTTKEKLELSNEDNILIVKGVEGRYKGLQSRVRINRDYDMQSINASLSDGVLTAAISKGKTITGNKIQIK
ncbi:MAG TPA: Hsp20/alpha crystallin family protein [Patescibacteria group bacterium]|nr:Hsp20/alpha crystallin family protein [Patescibacteria group bacterium]